MAGLVHELQREALDRSVNVSDLLRKALVVSRKLDIADIQEWLSYELNGYPSDFDCDLIPEYRLVHGSPKVYNPYHGWQPIHCADPEDAESLSKRKSSQAIGIIDDLASRRESGSLRMPYPPEVTNALMQGMDVPLQPVMLVSNSSLIGILDSVRNKVLEWALELEAKGVVGEGMSFSEREKQAANSVTYNVTNNIGSMSNSQFQQNSPHGSQNLDISDNLTQLTQFIGELKAHLEDLRLEDSKKEELEAEVSTIETQLSSPRPKSLIVNESLKSIRSVLEGITGSLIANGLVTQVTALLS